MNFTIKAKLTGGFLLILSLLIVSAVLMVNSLSETNERLTSIGEQSARRI